PRAGNDRHPGRAYAPARPPDGGGGGRVRGAGRPGGGSHDRRGPDPAGSCAGTGEGAETGMSQRVMIVVGTPTEAVEAVLEAIAGAGGGVVGNYTHCAYTNAGQGRFKPGA